MMFFRILVALLALPWTLLTGAVRLAARLAKLPRLVRAKNADHVVCPDGHPNAVMGRWACKCGANYLGHAFGPCPVCGAPAGWLRCETCGLAIRSPWKEN